MPFSPAMVSQIPRKTQTRRVVTPQPPSPEAVRAKAGDGYHWLAPQSGIPHWRPVGPVWAVRDLMGREPGLRCPYGQPGDRLWVREPWRVGVCADGFSPRELDPRTWKVDNGGLWYDATETEPKHPISERGRYRHARFMPRWASRITLELTAVRVERLHEISEEDVLAEGLRKLSKDGGRTWKFGLADRDGLPGNDDHGWHWREWEVSALAAYRKLWMQINGLASWDANPWVWVLEFGLVTP